VWCPGCSRQTAAQEGTQAAAEREDNDVIGGFKVVTPLQLVSCLQANRTATGVWHTRPAYTTRIAGAMLILPLAQHALAAQLCCGQSPTAAYSLEATHRSGTRHQRPVPWESPPAAAATHNNSNSSSSKHHVSDRYLGCLQTECLSAEVLLVFELDAQTILLAVSLPLQVQ
jgi:hypothetical protein